VPNADECARLAQGEQSCHSCTDLPNMAQYAVLLKLMHNGIAISVKL